MANPYIGNAPTDIPLSSAQLADGIVTTAKLASPIAPTISGGTINNAVIGGSTPAAATFTSLTATSGISGGTF